MFQLSSDERTVSLLKDRSLQAESDFQRSDQKTSTSESPGLNDRPSCPHWFDINDAKVQPIKEKDIEQQFQGKESAYMLFYRKSQLQRPPEGKEREMFLFKLMTLEGKYWMLFEILPFYLFIFAF